MKNKLKELEKRGFTIMDSANPFEEMRLKGPCTVILYRNGRVLVQGDPKIVFEIQVTLGLKAPKKIPIQKTSEESGLIIGSDETLKGDTFGGLVVAGFRANSTQREALKKMGVTDSKKLDDTKIRAMAARIKERFPDDFHIVNVNPEDYNSSIKAYGLTELMNELHKQVARKLKMGSPTHIVDKYPGCKVGDIIEEKAESKYLEVAAASILARDMALEQMAELSEKAGFKIPMGSTHVKPALQKLKKLGLDPKEFVKMNFSNVKEFF